MLCWLITGNIFADYVTNYPVGIVQPDGVKVICYVTGDEFYSRLHDSLNYTIVQNHETGFYCYAEWSGNQIIATDYIAGKTVPAKTSLTPGIDIPADEIRRIRLEKLKERDEYDIPPGITIEAKGMTVTSVRGQINNIVIFIRFSDQAEYTDNISKYEGIFNQNTGVSFKSYFRFASYNSVTVDSYFYPYSSSIVLSYQDFYPRAYYMPYSESNTLGYTHSQKRDREHNLLRRAVEFVKNGIPSAIDFDFDDNNLVDNITFIIQGARAAWNDLLWPHKWSLYTSPSVYINNTRVYTYNLVLSESISVGTLSHEFYHTLGAPDLYHYSHDGLHPVGGWDIMGATVNPPQSMGAYMKYRYGNWINDIPVISEPGTYSIMGISESENNCYRINSPVSSKEFYVLEFRKKPSVSGQFESNLTGYGLLVYRINTVLDGRGNSNGPPDEVYLYRQDGSTYINGNLSAAHYTTKTGRTEINDLTNPPAFLSDGKYGGLSIKNIREENGMMYFDLLKYSRPYVLTSPVSKITRNSALCGGNITYDPDSTVTVCGVCWSTEPGPTVALSTRTIDTSGSEVFDSFIEGLSPATEYYLRAYATNTSGTGYGNEISFKTRNPDAIADADSNYYNIVTIGTQTWMAENLKTASYINGDYIETTNPFTLNVSSEIKPGYQWLYNGDEANLDNYGRLYTWYTVTDNRKVCPPGWHIPSDAEWTTLTSFLGGTSVAGGRLKSTGTIEGRNGLWQSPNNGATDDIGFSAHPGGYRNESGGFMNIGISASFWTSSEYSSLQAYYISLHTENIQTSRINSYKVSGLSVRCIKDSEQTPTAIPSFKDVDPGSNSFNISINTTWKVSVFPNPSDGILTIQSHNIFSGDALLEIIDYYGRTVYTRPLESTGYQEIDLSHISGGIYILIIRNNDKLYFRKVVIR